LHRQEEIGSIARHQPRWPAQPPDRHCPPVLSRRLSGFSRWRAARK